MFSKIFKPLAIAATLLAISLISCTGGMRIDFSKYAPEVKLKNIAIGNLDLAGVDLDFTYEIRNKVNFEIIFSALEFIISADGKKLFNGKNKKNITLKPLGTSQFTLTHRIEFHQLDKNLEEVYSKDETNIALKGRIGIFLKWIKQSIYVPIKGSKKVPVPKLPEIAFQDFRLKSASTNPLNPHARYELKLRVKNPNKFPVSIERISYRFTVEKSSLARGKTSSLNIPPKKSRTVTIPISLEGKEALTLLPKLADIKNIDYRLSGAITLGLAGKNFNINYSLPEK